MQITSSETLDELVYAGVALGEGLLGSVGHIGILHRRNGGAPQFLHLAWHNDLRSHEPPCDGTYYWVRFQLEPEIQRVIAATCRTIFNANKDQGIPYAPLYSKTIFGDAGELLLGDTENGLTCATFVIAALAQAGIAVAELNSWPPREEDPGFKDGVIKALKRTLLKQQAELLTCSGESLEALTRECDALRAHIEKVIAEPRCVRYRPVEVAAAAGAPEHPVTFSLANRASEVVIDFVRQRIDEDMVFASDW